MPNKSISSAININLKQSINLLKQGDVFHAILEFRELLKHIMKNDKVNYPILLENFFLSLNILFDRNLAALEEMVKESNHIKASLIIIDLINIIHEMKKFYSQNLQIDQKKVISMSKLIENWTNKALKESQEIKTNNVSKKNFEKIFNSKFNLFSIIHGFYSEIYNSFSEKNSNNPISINNFHTQELSVISNFGNLFITLGNFAIKKGNLVKAKQMLELCIRILESNSIKNRFEKKVIAFQKGIIGLAADLELKAGQYFRKNQNFNVSIQHFKIAYTQYQSLQQNSKQSQAKEEYLKTCILSAQKDIKEAIKSVKNTDDDNAIFLFHSALQKLEKINAKKDHAQALEKLRLFYIQRGDEKLKLAKKISSISLNNLRKAINYLEDGRDLYNKAENTQKIKEADKLLAKSYKLHFKSLQREEQHLQNQKDYDKLFLIIEELHYLSYQMKNTNKAKEYAKRLEKLKLKIDYGKLDELRTQNLANKPWLNIRDPNLPSVNYEIPNQIPLKKVVFHSDNNLPDVAAQNLPPTIPFFTGFSPETLFSNTKKKTQNTPIIDSNISILQKSTSHQKQNQKDLAEIYQIIKKFNQHGFLKSSEIHILQSYGVNLPQDPSYYYKYKKSNYQFNVITTENDILQVLMFPAKNLISPDITLGTLARKVQPFIPLIDYPLFSTEILKQHIEFALNHPQWMSIIQGFQYSTLDCYFYFLHAIRLYVQNNSIHEIVNFINLSMIAETLNIPSEKFEKILHKFSSIQFIEEIFSLSSNPNFQLFFAGLFYLREKNLTNTAILWSNLQVT
ncbi:MAG: hypothetical protein ACTSVL_06440 [Promethearchaeota archaeon]